MGETVVAAVLSALVVVVVFVAVRQWSAGAGRVVSADPARTLTSLPTALALSGDHLSGGMLVGLLGLLLARGVPALWLTVGVIAGLVLSLATSVAPLRRSGAYTLSDFAEWRLGSRKVRRFTSAAVCCTAWLFLIAQSQIAGNLVHAIAGAPPWSGWAGVCAAALGVVLRGGVRRQSTVAQGLRWLLVVVALAAAAVLAAAIGGAVSAGAVSDGGPALGTVAHPGYARVSLVIAMACGTMGLPYLIVRLSALPTGQAARRAVAVAGGVMALPLALTAARASGFAPVQGAGSGGAFVWTPGVLRPIGVPGAAGTVFVAIMVAAVLLALFSSVTATSYAVAATIAQCLLGGGDRAFKFGGLIVAVVPPAAMVWAHPVAPGVLVPIAFAVSAGSLCPLLVLGIWWRHLTAVGAAAGMLAGGGLAVAGAVVHLAGVPVHGWWATWCLHPAAVTVPIGFAVMIGVSRPTRRYRPRGVASAMALMHLPDETHPVPATATRTVTMRVHSVVERAVERP